MSKFDPGSSSLSESSALPVKNAQSFFARVWSRELRGKLRIWGSWCAVPIYLLLVHQIPSWPAIAVLAVGTLMRVWASGLLNKESTLCTSGLYALSRNPLYVGSLLVAISMPLGQDEYILTAVVGGVFLLLFRSIIAREEAVLSEKFGEEYAAYKKSVPMFLGLASVLNLPRAIRYNLFSAKIFKVNRGWEPVLIALAIFLITSLVAMFRG